MDRVETVSADAIIIPTLLLFYILCEKRLNLPTVYVITV